jgi:hypothetical protein
MVAQQILILFVLVQIQVWLQKNNLNSMTAVEWLIEQLKSRQ